MSFNVNEQQNRIEINQQLENLKEEIEEIKKKYSERILLNAKRSQQVLLLKKEVEKIDKLDDELSKSNKEIKKIKTRVNEIKEDKLDSEKKFRIKIKDIEMKIKKIDIYRNEATYTFELNTLIITSRDKFKSSFFYAVGIPWFLKLNSTKLDNIEYLSFFLCTQNDCDQSDWSIKGKVNF